MYTHKTQNTHIHTTEGGGGRHSKIDPGASTNAHRGFHINTL